MISVRSLIFLLASLMLLLPVFPQVQTMEVKRSQEKTVVDGRIFYIHTVQKGQTLYSISKAYEISQEEISLYNSGVNAGNLKEGQALRIPEVSTRQAQVYPENRKDYTAHKVKKGQTVYSLAHKYRVTEEIIYEHNPWARGGIQPDQTLWIPHTMENTEQEYPEALPGYLYYTAKEKDTLYSIALLYGVDVSDIVESNPELRDGLRKGQVLKIPRAAEPVPEVPPDLEAVEEVSPCMLQSPAANYNVALLLPFFARYSMEELTLPADTLAEEGTYVPQQRQQGLRGRSFAEFYEGFLLAVDSMKRAGLSINLHVYDTERDTMKVKKIVRELSLVNPDLVLGPVYSQDVSIAGRMALYQETNLVSPLSTKPSLISGNPHVFQVIPPRELECEGLARYLSQYKRGQVILVRGTDSLSMRDSWIFKKYLMANPPVDESGNSLYFRDFRLNDSLISHLGKVMSQQTDNIVVVISENEADVSRLVTKLYMMSTLYPVRLFGMPSWQIWKTIDLSYFHSLQLQLISPFYTNYNSPQVKKFLHACRMAYGYEPYEISSRGYNFCMLGYDLGLYFLTALKLYGRDFQSCLGEINSQLLLSDYHFIKAGEGGYLNTAFNLIRYNPDFTIEKVSVLHGSLSY